jgi:hypothetical protein
MTVHAVVLAGADHRALDADMLNELQWEQHQHDEQYHREIARLTVHDRWKHMALHFAKYAGNLVEKVDSDECLERAVVDTFIIALSTSNTLNIRASELVSRSAVAVVTAQEFLVSLVTCAGKMAAACEKLDHIESVTFRDEVTGAVSDLLAATVTLAESKRWVLDQLVRTRLAAVKKKWIHHDRMTQR